MAHVLRGTPPAGPVLPASAFDALARARARVVEAEETARRVLADAEARAAGALEAAREAGRAEGRAEAGAVLLRAAAERDRLLATAGPEVVALAVEVARKVLGLELRSGADVVAALAARALGAAREHREVRLRVCPADLDAVRAAVPAGVAVEAGPELGEGECQVLTAAGRIEAGLEAQLEQLARALLPGAGP